MLVKAAASADDGVFDSTSVGADHAKEATEEALTALVVRSSSLEAELLCII